MAFVSLMPGSYVAPSALSINYPPTEDEASIRFVTDGTTHKATWVKYIPPAFAADPTNLTCHLMSGGSGDAVITSSISVYSAGTDSFSDPQIVNHTITLVANVFSSCTINIADSITADATFLFVQLARNSNTDGDTMPDGKNVAFFGGISFGGTANTTALEIAPGDCTIPPGHPSMDDDGPIAFPSDGVAHKATWTKYLPPDFVANPTNLRCYVASESAGTAKIVSSVAFYSETTGLVSVPVLVTHTVVFGVGNLISFDVDITSGIAGNSTLLFLYLSRDSSASGDNLAAKVDLFMIKSL